MGVEVEVDDDEEDEGTCGDANDLVSTDNELNSLPAEGSISKPDILLIVVTVSD